MIGTLSEIASALYRLQQDFNVISEEMALWGAPSECFRDECRALEKEREKIFERFDITEEEFDELLATRISGKAIYYLHL